MCFILTCGEHEFSSQLKGYESVVCQCHNCGNYSAHVIKRWPWFTLCFIPILPLAFHAYEDVICTICNFAQPLANREDVRQQMNGAGGDIAMQNQPPGQGPPPGWNGQPPAQNQPPKQGEAMTYG